MYGKFICIEGGEGVGKTTMSAKVTYWLRNNGYNVEEVFDPGSTPLAKKLREIVLDKEIPCNPHQQALLYIAARAALAEEVLEKLSQGIHVVCGRWTLSTLVYQGLCGEVGLTKVRQLANDFVKCDPHLYIVLDATPEIALKRKREAAGSVDFDKDRFDSRGLDWHNKIRGGYREFAINRGYPIVNADRPLAEVTHDVLTLCVEKLGLKP